MKARSTHLLPTILVAAVCLQGHCGAAPDAPPAAPPQPPPAGPPELFSVPPVRPPRPSDVVADVNGTKLTRRELETELAIRFASLGKQIPPEHAATAHNRTRREIIQQFVTRTLLLQEAEREGLKVTPEDEKKALDAWAARRAPGTDPRDALHGGPVGPERMRRELVAGLTIEKLIALRTPGDLAITEERVADFHRENSARYATPETVHARHILVAVPREANADLRTRKREEALDISRRLLAGADFAEMAAQHSDCPSKSRGGDLGAFPRGRMVPPFEKAAFHQEVEAIGRVLETDFGYHIIQVLAHTPSSTLTLDRARQMLERQNKQIVLKRLIDSLKKKADIKPAHILDLPPPMPPPMPGAPRPPQGK